MAALPQHRSAVKLFGKLSNGSARHLRSRGLLRQIDACRFERFNESLRIQIACRLARSDGLNRGCSGGLAHHGRSRLHADRSVNHHIARRAAPRNPKIRPLLGNENSIRKSKTLPGF